jgi:hypothetical protein
MTDPPVYRSRPAPTFANVALGLVTLVLLVAAVLLVASVWVWWWRAVVTDGCPPIAPASPTTQVAAVDDG